MLREQLEEAHKTILALADARAYAIRYPRGAPPRDAPTDAEGHPIRPAATSPAELRRNRSRPATDATLLTPEEYERTFQAERDILNSGGTT